MRNLREFKIRCFNIQDKDALVHVCAAGTSLESLSISIQSTTDSDSDSEDFLPVFSTFEQIVNAVRNYLNLKHIEFGR